MPKKEKKVYCERCEFNSHHSWLDECHRTHKVCKRRYTGVNYDRGEIHNKDANEHGNCPYYKKGFWAD